ncbi:helix-turn-helix transcriptional regulator [Inquilinus sp. NPDC058860]|uniref:helix-turn-helix transcriptional regulator n=1 Tax=Inquilinus sp. NPDC058860 TaxID=3346652 RepID=UPI0036AD3E07
MAYERRIEPRATGWRSFAWAGGVFDTARRPYTEAVEGTILIPHHLVLVTLAGGARHQEVVSSCGHRYVGSDRPGAVSFVPADCERRLRLHGVESEWASISLDPALLQDEVFDRAGRSLDGTAFTNQDAPFLAGMVAEAARLAVVEGGLDRAYGEAMSWALAHHLVRRYGHATSAGGPRGWALPPWRLRRIVDYVDAHLGAEIRIADLARLVGLSPGRLHRAFRATTGQTPLAFINDRRIRRAMRMLDMDGCSIAEIALRCGFISPSHFARVFRSVVGMAPSRYRAVNGTGPRDPVLHPNGTGCRSGSVA